MVNELIKRLRELTGCGLMYAKNALSKFDNDFDKALSWIKRNPPGRVFIDRKYCDERNNNQ